MVNLIQQEESNNGQGLPKTVLKLKYGTDIRKTQLVHNNDYSLNDLVAMVQRVFKLTNENNLLLKYRDSDGDWITVADDNDLLFGFQENPLFVEVFMDKSEQDKSTTPNGAIQTAQAEFTEISLNDSAPSQQQHQINNNMRSPPMATPPQPQHFGLPSQPPTSQQQQPFAQLPPQQQHQFGGMGSKPATPQPLQPPQSFGMQQPQLAQLPQQQQSFGGDGGQMQKPGLPPPPMQNFVGLPSQPPTSQPQQPFAQLPQQQQPFGGGYGGQHQIQPQHPQNFGLPQQPPTSQPQQQFAQLPPQQQQQYGAYGGQPQIPGPPPQQFGTGMMPGGGGGNPFARQGR